VSKTTGPQIPSPVPDAFSLPAQAWHLRAAQFATSQQNPSTHAVAHSRQLLESLQSAARLHAAPCALVG
jgi:hypothetical protein